MLRVPATTLSAVLLAVIAALGCKTNAPTPLTTTVLEAPLEVAPPAPLPVVAPPLAAAAKTPLPWPSEWINSWVPIENWSQYNGLPPARLASANPHPTYELQTAAGNLAIKVGSRAVRRDDAHLWLAFAPRMIRGVPCLHWLDAQKNLQPLLSEPNYSPGANSTIVIDPGHGGADSGARSVFNGELEKNYTLDWALRLSRLLSSNGWRVVLTRDRDVEVSLQQRVATAERANAALFISLHFNSGGANRDLAGIETYCLTPVGMPSSLVRDGEDDITKVFPNNTFDEENLHLAFRLHRGLVRATAAPDRGVRRARFMGVLRGQNRPAVLIEGGYLTHPEEAKKVGAVDHRERLAVGVASVFALTSVCSRLPERF